MLFSHVLVKCDVSIFNMYVLCTNHNMFQQEVKGLFIRFSKNCLTPPLLLKLTTNLWIVADFCLNYLPPPPAIWELGSRGWGAVDIGF